MAKTNIENDFGFTFVDESEFREYEETLKEQITQHSTVANQTQDKMNRVLAIINPFLTNLGSDPDKIYIKWKNRGAIIKNLQTQIATILKE